MKRALCTVSIVLILAAAPTPLVTGAVRDRSGAPVAGALVRAGTAEAVTGTDGTFVLHANAAQVRISCAYCRDTIAPVDAEGIVTAIVLRYTAVSQTTPSAEDLQTLPYAMPQSVVSLQPYAVLYDTRDLAGPQISLMGIDRSGALLVDDGVPSYDIASGSTPFREFPAYSLSSFSVEDALDAPRYGDRAGSGTFALDTLPSGNSGATVSGGGENSAEISGAAPGLAIAAGASADGSDDRARFDALARGGIVSANAFSASSTYDDSEYGSVAGFVSGAHVHAQRDGALSVYADAVADRGDYAASTASVSAWDSWSDASLDAGVVSSGSVRAFADAGTRYSSGDYQSTYQYFDRLAGGIAQSHVSAGMESTSGALSYEALLGGFDVRFVNGAADSRMLLPSLQTSLALGSSWSVSAGAGESYRVPSLLEQYADSGSVSGAMLDRFDTSIVQLNYGDDRRFRAGLAAQRSFITGPGGGNDASLGGFVAWQVTPNVSLRAWTLHLDDSTLAPELSSTPAVAWAAYRSGGFTADVIWRRDILDQTASPHLDASIGVPLQQDVWIVVASEVHAGKRYTSLQLRRF